MRGGERASMRLESLEQREDAGSRVERQSDLGGASARECDLMLDFGVAIGRLEITRRLHRVRGRGGTSRP